MRELGLAMLLGLLLGLLLAGCQDSGENSNGQLNGMPVPEGVKRSTDASVLAMGKAVYQQHCADCHGADASGSGEWRKRDAEGFFPPPPLNGSGHAWHHSREVLANVILTGSPDGKGRMPAWEGKLSQQEVDAVITWFQSTWPQPVYDAWFEMQQRGR